MGKYDQMRRSGLVGAVLLAAAGLSACTTVEGTNALVDPATFEREVGISTLQGLGMVPQESKETLDTPRAPLVLPKDTDKLPAPTEDTESELLPEDSDKVQIDTTNLSEEDLRRLRNARVFDMRSVSGRPLTDQETAQLAARIQSGQIQTTDVKPLWVPADEYFVTTSAGQDLVCLAPNGDLVSLNDPACPEEIRQALQAQSSQ